MKTLKWVFTLLFAGIIGGLALLGGDWSTALGQSTIPTIPTLPGQNINPEILPVGPGGDLGCFTPFPANTSVTLCVYVPNQYAPSNMQLSNPPAVLNFPQVQPAYILGQPFNFNFSVTTQPYSPPLIFYFYYADHDVSSMFEPFLKLWVYKNGTWEPLPTTVDTTNNMLYASISSLDSPSTFAVFEAGTRWFYFPFLSRIPVGPPPDY